MKPPKTLLLTREHVAKLLGLDDCIEAVERALVAHADGRTLPPQVLGVQARDGGFHIKAAGLLAGGEEQPDEEQRDYFAAKVNGNFSDNPKRHGLPAIQGLIVLCDATRGTPLAVMDSIEVTILRTGAATAVAAKYLARPDARVATVCGCGNQGRVQLRALLRVRKLERVFAFDTDRAQAERYAAQLTAELGIEVQSVEDPSAAVRASQICVTCTPSRRPFLKREDVAPGTFVAAVGADSPEKHELHPELVAAGKVVVDHLEQCATLGDLHHAIAAGRMTRGQVHAELADVVAGRKPGRTSPDEIIVFDSTGTALQDVAAAALVFERAVASGVGLRLAFPVVTAD